MAKSNKNSTANKTKVETEELEAEVAPVEYVKVFMKTNVMLKGLPPMFPKIRYSVPKDRLREFPKDSYVLV
jgi:hypothetical protein